MLWGFSHYTLNVIFIPLHIFALDSFLKHIRVLILCFQVSTLFQYSYAECKFLYVDTELYNYNKYHDKIAQQCQTTNSLLEGS